MMGVLFQAALEQGIFMSGRSIKANNGRPHLTLGLDKTRKAIGKMERQRSLKGGNRRMECARRKSNPESLPQERYKTASNRSGTLTNASTTERSM